MSRQGDSHPSKCAYCVSVRKSKSGGLFLCKYKGVVPEDHLCGKYTYDPTMRIPLQRRGMEAFEASDFEL